MIKGKDMENITGKKVINMMEIDKREGRGKKIYKNYGEYHIGLNIINKIIIKKA